MERDRERDKEQQTVETAEEIVLVFDGHHELVRDLVPFLRVPLVGKLLVGFAR